MLKMLKEDGPKGVPLVILGLSHGNLDRLRGGEPIRLDIDQCAMLGFGQSEVVIYAGTDELAMVREIESAGLVPPGTVQKTREHMESARDDGP